MSKSALAPEELKAQRTAQRRKEFQERLQAERAQAELKQQIKERNEARLAELREQELREARSAQLREEARSANEAELLAAENRAAQLKVQFREEERSTRQEKAAERARHEQESHAAALKREEEEKQIRLRAARQEEQRLTRQQEEMARAQREKDLHSEILQRREKEKQARSLVKHGEEEQLARRQSEIKARHREPEIPDEPPTQAQRDETSLKTAMLARENRATALRDEQRVAETDAAERKQKEEVRAAEQRQLRADRERLRDAEEQRAAAAAAKMRQATLQAELEMQQAALVTPRKNLVQKAEPAAVPESKRRSQSVSPAPRAPTAAGSMARAAVAATAAGNVDASPPAPPDTTPYVQTRGNFIIDENGDAVYLRGVTVRGLDTAAPLSGQTFPAALSLDPGNLASITDQWGANLVRLPFAANTVLSGNGTLSSSDLLAGLDLAVAAITEAGAYVLLALEASAGSQPSDANTTQVWETLALRYQNEPRVFYEVFFSSAPITGIMPAQFPSLVATVRQQNPASLIFLSAGAGGADVSGVPVFDAPDDPVPNIVYTIAVSAQNVPNQDVLSAVSSSYPVFASVWSDDGTDLGRLSSHVADLFERYGIGWSAANWNADPRLVADAAGQDFTPTIWGNVAQRALKLTVPPLLEPSDAPASLSALRAANPKLAQLTTSGSFIVGGDGKAISLRGVTVVGLDTAAPASGQTLPSVLALDENNLALMRETWGLNLVRLPFQAQTVLAGNGALSAGKILGRTGPSLWRFFRRPGLMSCSHWRRLQRRRATVPDASTAQVVADACKTIQG